MSDFSQPTIPVPAGTCEAAYQKMLRDAAVRNSAAREVRRAHKARVQDERAARWAAELETL